MRWMGGWSYADLAGCPESYVQAALELMVEWQEAQK